MQLSRPDGARDARDVASAVRRVASSAGHRPALTLLAPTGRQEQSFTSVAQWVSKTAHWLALDLLLEPGDRLGVVGPPGWVPAVAALGAWWAGLTVVLGPEADGADVVVAHADGVPAVTGDLVVWGWEFDGTPASAGPTEPFVHAVQPFPDDPPAPVGTERDTALDDGARTLTQAELLASVHDEPANSAGVDPTASPWLPAATVRPLVTGRPTVLLAPGVDRTAADGDRVAHWLT